MLGYKSMPSGILCLDPSGSPPPSETGYIFYENWQNYEIGAITGKNAAEHGKNIDLLIKKLKPLYVVWETSFWLKVNKANKHFLQLIFLIGILNYLININNISPKYAHEILNVRVVNALNKEIPGLELKKKKWYFRNQLISVHQRDAIAVFFSFLTERMKKPWPWE